MNPYVRMGDDPDFVRDTSSGAIINTNDSHYMQILAARSQARQAKDVCARMNAIESEMRDIRALLQQVLDGRKNG